jgi:hypothetical protein
MVFVPCSNPFACRASQWASPLGGASSRGDCWRNLAFKQSCRDRRYLIAADRKGFMSGYELNLHV